MKLQLIVRNRASSLFRAKMSEQEFVNPNDAEERREEGSQPRKTSGPSTPPTQNTTTSTLSEIFGIYLSPGPRPVHLPDFDFESPPYIPIKKKVKTVEGSMMLAMQDYKTSGEDCEESDEDEEFANSDSDYELEEDDNANMEMESYLETPEIERVQNHGINTTPPSLIPISWLMAIEDYYDRGTEQLPMPMPRPSLVPRLVMSQRTFYSFKLSKYLLESLRANLGITSTTFVQEQVLLHLMCEQDVFIRAGRATGKTIAVLVGLIHNLSSMRPKLSREDGIRAIIVVPTKEIVKQTYELFKNMAKCAPWIEVAPVGANTVFSQEQDLLRRGVSVMIGTPSRIMDHFRFTVPLNLNNMAYLIYDGVDKMFLRNEDRNMTDIIEVLEKGMDYLIYPDYIRTIRTENVEGLRQTVLTSSIYSTRVERFSRLHQTKPFKLNDPYATVPGGVLAATFTSRWFMKTIPSIIMPPQHYMIVPEKIRLVSLIAFLVYEFNEQLDERIIIYFATQSMVDYYGDMLAYTFRQIALASRDDPRECMTANFHFFRLNHNMSLSEKNKKIFSFSTATRAILLCTDSTMRFADHPSANWVIHFNTAPSMCDYMRRVEVSDYMPGSPMNPSICFFLPSELAYINELAKIRVSIEKIRMKKYLRQLWHYYTPSDTMEDIVRDMQSVMETAVNQSPYLYDLACLAYASWRRYYMNYPENVKGIFQIERVHQNNFVRSFGLAKPAAEIISRVRNLLLYSHRFEMEHEIIPEKSVKSVSTQTPMKFFVSVPKYHPSITVELLQRLCLQKRVADEEPRNDPNEPGPSPPKRSR